MGESGKIVVGGSDAELPVEAISLIGLAVNELVTNAAKYGATVVQVTFERADERLSAVGLGRRQRPAGLRSIRKRARDWA